MVNAIAHRDYGIEGKEIEIFIYDDRLEVQSPGGLLSSISIADLTSEKRTHQSRNVFIARVLREAGYMREMGEGMLRIYRTMRDRDLVPPELKSSAARFEVGLHHRSIFSPKDQEWLRAYAAYNLSRDEQRTVLLGKDSRLLSTNDIVNTLKIVDTEEFRKHVERLRRKGILYSAVERGTSGVKAFEKGRSRPRFAVRPPDQTDQYREDLLHALAKAGRTDIFTPPLLKKINRELSAGNPFAEKVAESLKLLALVDERLRPLPILLKFWDKANVVASEMQSVRENLLKSKPAQLPHKHSAAAIKTTKAKSEPEKAYSVQDFSNSLQGRVVTLNSVQSFGFIKGSDDDYYFDSRSIESPYIMQNFRVGSTVRFRVQSRRTLKMAGRAIAVTPA